MQQQQIEGFLSFLERETDYLTPRQLEVLYQLAAHPDSYVRARVAALLVDHFEERSQQVLLALSRDPEAMVRCEAVDSLCIGLSEEVLERLLELAEMDEDRLVRGYAVMSVFDVYLNLYGETEEAIFAVQTMLEELFRYEEDTWVQAAYHSVFYDCGSAESLEDLLDLLEDPDVDVKNFVLQCCVDFLDIDNEEIIKGRLEELIPHEEHLMSAFAMEKLLEMEAISAQFGHGDPEEYGELE